MRPAVTLAFWLATGAAAVVLAVGLGLAGLASVRRAPRTSPTA